MEGNAGMRVGEVGFTELREFEIAASGRIL
jgi:hypothetical protein